MPQPLTVIQLISALEKLPANATVWMEAIEGYAPVGFAELDDTETGSSRYVLIVRATDE